MEKKRVGILGATGMVGMRLVTLLAHHPWFSLSVLAASARNAGKRYIDAVGDGWCMNTPIPRGVGEMVLKNGENVEEVGDGIDILFSAVSMEKEKTIALEEAYAKREVVVISNNSACREIADVPMLIPEINADHIQVLPFQRKRLGTKRGCIVTKPNCSIQSYVPPLTPLLPFGVRGVVVSTYQAVSGAGKTLQGYPAIQGTVIPYIPGEEIKSREEPKKVWGWVEDGSIHNQWEPVISAHCVRVPVQDGHLATVSVKLRHPIPPEDIRQLWADFHPLRSLALPSSPAQLIVYREEQDRPQPLLDNEEGGGMSIVVGRLEEDPLLDFRFVALSHNTLRGAGGGSVLTAEYLTRIGIA